MGGSSGMDRICSFCGAVLPPGMESCSDTLKAFAERVWLTCQSNRVILIPSHCWSLQHPTLQTPQDIAWDLMFLCRWVGFDDRAGNGLPLFQEREWLEECPAFPYLYPSGHLGALTVSDLYWTTTEEGSESLVDSWASSVWEAWSDYHAWAHAQVRRFFVRNQA
jgi:hypothetical protein